MGSSYIMGGIAIIAIAEAAMKYAVSVLECWYGLKKFSPLFARL